MLTFNVDLHLIFGIPDRAIKVKVTIKDNQVPKASKHFDNSSIINE